MPPHKSTAGDEALVALGDQVKVYKSADGLTGYVEGLAIRYSDPETLDLDGEYFDRETYLGQAIRAGVDATLNHTMPIKTGVKAVDAVLKRMSSMVFTNPVTTEEADLGVVAKHVLDLADRFEAFVYGLAEKGAFRWSAGSAPHLARYEPVGKAIRIRNYPVGEFAYTPIAADPNLPRIAAVKSLAGLQLAPELIDGVEIPDLGSPAVKSGITINAQNVHITQKESIMPPNQDPQAAPATPAAPAAPAADPDLQARVDAAVKSAFAQQAAPAADPAIEEAAIAAAAAAVKSYAAQIAKVPTNDPGLAAPATPAGQPDGQPEIVQLQRAPGTYKSTHLLSYPMGDDELKSIAAWIRTGDGGTYKAASGLRLMGGSITIKASNDTSMNIATAADGGNAVPTGHFGEIIARRDESLLAAMLGVRRITGRGTTVNVPIDNEADGEFVSTAEQDDAHAQNFDRDAPAIGTKAFTLVKYTKKVELTDELMDDEDSNLMDFLANFVGRGLAKTENNLMLVEVAANGTAFKTFAIASAIGNGELEDIEGNDDLGAYLDEPGVGWVMRNSTLAAIRKIEDTANRIYSVQGIGGMGVRNARELLQYPVWRSNNAAAIAASAKSVYFGNWYYVGRREGRELTLLRDPYTVDGMLLLKYHFRVVYGVLQAEAIGYGVHSTATA